MSFLTALFQVDWKSAASIFQQDGVLEAIMDSVDLAPSEHLARTVAQLLSQAIGHKPCRGGLSPQAIKWLDFTSQNSSNANTRITATNALIKLSKGSAFDNAQTLGDAVGDVQTRVGSRNDEDLAASMKAVIVAGANETSLADAVEGLAYLSVDPMMKEELSQDTVFLKRLFSLVPRRKTNNASGSIDTPTTLAFGVLSIASNLCTYRPRLTEEQIQMEKLRNMASAPKANTKSSSPSILDDDDHVRARIRRAIDVGVLDIFSLVIRSDTVAVRALTAKALLSIVEEKDNRGKVLQSGGAKVLMHIIKQSMPFYQQSLSSASPQALETTTLDAIQALAKLAITSSPIQVFGPNEGAMYDAIRPFSLMLQGSSSTLLQRFESMMALTNLSSQGTETATRIAKSDGLLQKVELLLLEDHTLVRRAAMELICNLIAGSDEVFERYGGEDNPSATKSKLQIMFALSDVDDLPTRLAASGAVATLTSAPSACAAIISLQSDKHRVFSILAQLIDPSVIDRDNSEEEKESIDLEVHPGLVHRAIISTRNIFSGVSDKVLLEQLIREAEEAGLQHALMNLVKTQGGRVDAGVLRPAVEALQVLMDKS
ncbi:Unc-45 like protein [Termitomyces sp. J132]|nr:Unc-45 like protein [Termitomyces sp. J132]